MRRNRRRRAFEGGDKYMLKLQMKLTERLRALQEREEGQAMVEYALILSLVSVAALITLDAVGLAVDGVLGDVLAEL
jgi:Flp pilus assembly pilin Flp